MCLALPAALTVGLIGGRAEDPTKAGLKTEHFDADPGWEGVNNHIVPAKLTNVIQCFGYSASNFAGKAAGEMGGRVRRASRPAYYADKLTGKTLNDKLSAAGSFAITATEPGSGVFFGWFNADQPGGGGRPMNSLGLDFDGERQGARLAVRLIGGTNRSCGTFVTPFVPGMFRPTPNKNDGTRYAWTLDYDPDANDGNGRFQFSITGNTPNPEEFEGKTFSVDLPAGFKKDGATFDRFGLMNMMKPGGGMTIHFDDLTHDGKTEDFAKDPGWVGSGNRVDYKDPLQVGAHDFGFHPDTNFAGGKAGEVGGDLWRSGKVGYYADKVGPLSRDDRLEASGKVVLKVGAPDSDMFIGWFHSGDVGDKSPAQGGDFLGVHVGGPTRVGHYFHPAYSTAKGKAVADKGPVLVPGKAYDWTLVYDPAGNGGKGEIVVTLGQESVKLPIREARGVQGKSFDRFGLLTSNIGGQLVRVYFDDLTYTASRPAR
jgi:hypothetical protein